jgi:hypothetical protein
MANKACKDCGSTTRKMIDPKTDKPYPGPRCCTCHRAKKKADKARNRDVYVSRTYSLTPSQYRAVLDAQNGKCYICRRATGATKAMPVDHSHSCCPGKTSCGKCVRAICCGPCNKNVLGHLRDDIEALMRAIEVIRDWPAQRVLRELEKHA